MKSIISKQDVAKAIESLKATGKKPTLQAIHAAIGGKGSLSTIQKFRSELEAELVTSQDSEESLQVFQQLWAKAVEEGSALKEAQCAELREALDAMAAESEKTAGELIALQERTREIEAQRDGLIADLAKASEQVTAARASGGESATKLAASLERIAELQASHSETLASLRGELSESEKKGHETALTLARTEARLSSSQDRLAEAERQRDALLGDLGKANEQTGTVRAAGEQTAAKLAAVLERTAALQAGHAAELAEAQRKAHELEMKLARFEESPKPAGSATKARK